MNQAINQAVDGDDYTWQAAPAVLKGVVNLRTLDQRERDDFAELTLRCDTLVDALEALARWVVELERARVAQ